MARVPTSLAAVAIGAALAVGALAAPAAAAKKPPVKIGGKVNNEGVTKAKNGAVDLEVDSFSFDKTFVKAAPGEVVITLTNESGVPHTFTIDDQNVEEDIAPGTTKTVTVDVPEGDPVVFYCRFHVSSGMQGALFTAKGGGPATTRVTSAGGYGY